MMVRGDVFYMAICNKSVTVAIYNERNNLFLSPFVDGPVKFVTNINNEMNIKNVSKFGKDFSIVRVPYAFKLLMQELQAMNVQMRVITEDNVDRLTSLKEGEDIVKISGYDSLETIANENKKQILGSDKNNYFKDTNILIEQEPIPMLPTNLMGYRDDGDWEQQDQIYTMPMMEGDVNFINEAKKIGPKESDYKKPFTESSVEEVSMSPITPSDTPSNESNNTPQTPDYGFNQPEKTPPPSPQSPEFGFNQPEKTTSETPSPWMEMEGEIGNYSDLSKKKVNSRVELVEDDYEDDDEEEKKEKITIINDGDIDNKDLEILTPPNINKEDEETSDSGNSDSGVKKGIKIDL